MVDRFDYDYFLLTYFTTFNLLDIEHIFLLALKHRYPAILEPECYTRIEVNNSKQPCKKI